MRKLKHKNILFKKALCLSLSILYFTCNISSAAVVVIAQKKSGINQLSALDCKKVYMNLTLDGSRLANFHGIDLPTNSSTRDIFYEKLWNISATQSGFMRDHIGAHLTMTNQNSIAKLVSSKTNLIAYINTSIVDLQNYPDLQIINVITNSNIAEKSSDKSNAAHQAANKINATHQAANKKDLVQKPSAPGNTLVFPIVYRPQKFNPLDDIARTYNVSVSDIIKWNHIKPRVGLRPGETITLYLPIENSASIKNHKPGESSVDDADNFYQLIQATFADASKK